jgi:hypothetical protein
MKIIPLLMQRERAKRRKQNRAITLSPGEERFLLSNGWERVGETGGRLWELYRGGRSDCIITDVKIAYDGLSLIVKVEPIQPRPA